MSGSSAAVIARADIQRLAPSILLMNKTAIAATSIHRELHVQSMRIEAVRALIAAGASFLLLARVLHSSSLFPGFGDPPVAPVTLS